MQQENYIAELLSRFLNGSLTPAEKSELYHIVMDSRRKDEIIAWLQQQWDRAPQQAGEIPSEAMFAQIRERIATEQSAPHAGRKVAFNQKSKMENGKWTMFFRYAAVFVIAFGISWAVQKKTASSVEHPVVAVMPLQYNEILVPYGSKTKVKLPDSSTVWLNAGARLKFPAHFDGNLREVYLQGEGFFDVTKDSLHPFIVNSNGVNIKVHGTKFNLMANADDNIIETTLVEGAIEILGLKDVDNQSNMILKPGQKLTISKVNDQYKIHSIHEAGLSMPGEDTTSVKIKSANLLEKANVELATAWTENKLVFVKERFGDVKTKLERWYGVIIDVKDPEILDYRFTGSFEKQTFEQAMSALSKAASCKFKVDKNSVVVTKK